MSRGVSSGELSGIAAIRERIRAEHWTRPTAEIGRGWLQTNLVILPREAALSFVTYCRRNPRPCPLLEVTEPGDPHLHLLAHDADLRTDLPRYHVYRDGVLVDTPTSIADVWRDDLVAFLIGCSFTFEQALIEAGIEVRHVTARRNVAMYRTSIPSEPSGGFHSNLVVSMRPIKKARIPEVLAICSGYPFAHGRPILADATRLGITNIARPDFGDPIEIADDEDPVFWACGVTASQAAISAALDLTICHAPGHMFVSDWPHIAARDAGMLLGDPLSADFGA